MDQDLKQYLETKFAEIDKRFEAVDNRFEEERAALRQVETNLLTAFHTWARTFEVRSRAVGAAVIGFDERLSLIEDRLSELERKQAS